MTHAVRAQSLLEYCILAVVVMVALMSMQAYMKRGLQGRWKDSVDQVGEQYDTSMQGTVTHTIKTKSSTAVVTQNGKTLRTDTDSTTETKKVDMQGAL